MVKRAGEENLPVTPGIDGTATATDEATETVQEPHEKSGSEKKGTPEEISNIDNSGSHASNEKSPDEENDKNILNDKISGLGKKDEDIAWTDFFSI